MKSPLLDDNPFCSWVDLPTVDVYPTSSSYELLILTPKSDGPSGVLNNLGFLSTLFPGSLDKSIRENVPSSLSSTCWSLTVSLYVFSSLFLLHSSCSILDSTILFLLRWLMIFSIIIIIFSYFFLFFIFFFGGGGGGYYTLYFI